MSSDAGNLHHLFNHPVKRLRLLRLAGAVVSFFAFASGLNEATRTQEAQMMGNCRTAHLHHGRNVDDTFFAVT